MKSFSKHFRTDVGILKLIMRCSSLEWFFFSAPTQHILIHFQNYLKCFWDPSKATLKFGTNLCCPKCFLSQHPHNKFHFSPVSSQLIFRVAKWPFQKQCWKFWPILGAKSIYFCEARTWQIPFFFPASP